MSLKVYPNTKIYILSYSNIETGGIECLYMLCDKLLSLGYDAYLYFQHKVENPLSDYYSMYNVKYTFEIEDSNENILIVPEVSPFTIFNFNNIQKSIWWLSVDFYLNYCRLYNNLLDFSKPKAQEIVNLSHSAYTTNFLIQEGAKNIFKLSDYLNHVFTSKDPQKENREDVVLYNPVKGIQSTRIIMEHCPDIKFVSIKDMKRDQISELMCKSKVYIDFGFHPGQDRLPREAVASGCVVLTNKVGSAFFFEDVPLTDDYKFGEFKPDKVREKLLDVFKNFDLHFNNFKRYRYIVSNHEKAFESQIKNCFKKI